MDGTLNGNMEPEAALKPATRDRPTLYLRPDVKIEPLVDGWHAWPHLLSPATQALNLAYRYLPIVHSFLAAPAVHVAASEDPTMFGGPFLDLAITAVEDLRVYAAKTETRRFEALEFAKQFREFEAILRTANGYSLDGLRDQLPTALRGRVELAYDLNNHPKMRLLEEMFDFDDLGLNAAQEIVLHRINDLDRPFFLSTPRLPCVDNLNIASTFNSVGVKMLCESRYAPVDLEKLSALLGVTSTSLRPFFTDVPPPPSPPSYIGDGVRIRYFGHASLLIETSEISILIDPTASFEKLVDQSHFTIADFPDRIDVLLISHGHQDHFHPEVLMQLRSRVGVVIIPPHNHGEPSDPSLRRLLSRLGFDNVVTLEPLEQYNVEGGAITALPFSGEHCDLDVHSKQCAVIDLKGRKICLFVDSDAVDIDVYTRLTSHLLSPDLMFIGMECFGAPLSWLYGPLISTPISNKNDGSRRLSGANATRARRLTEALKPKEVFVYAMGQEPWMRYLMGLQYQEGSVQLTESRDYVQWCLEQGIPAERLYLCKEIEI